MSEYDVLDYIPVIGDIYRYGRLGYKIGTWIAEDEDSYNNRILSQMADSINNIGTSNDIVEIYNNATEAANLISGFDHENCKKYQIAIALYLAARIYHIWGLCECIVYSDDLNNLKTVRKNFVEAKTFCCKVREIDKTWFTSKRDIIDQVREMADDKKAEINDSIYKWRKQYRALYKKCHPIKWFLGMWLLV